MSEWKSILRPYCYSHNLNEVLFFIPINVITIISDYNQTLIPYRYYTQNTDEEVCDIIICNIGLQLLKKSKLSVSIFDIDNIVNMKDLRVRKRKRGKSASHGYGYSYCKKTNTLVFKNEHGVVYRSIVDSHQAKYMISNIDFFSNMLFKNNVCK